MKGAGFCLLYQGFYYIEVYYIKSRVNTRIIWASHHCNKNNFDFSITHRDFFVSLALRKEWNLESPELLGQQNPSRHTIFFFTKRYINCLL